MTERLGAYQSGPKNCEHATHETRFKKLPNPEDSLGDDGALVEGIPPASYLHVAPLAVLLVQLAQAFDELLALPLSTRQGRGRALDTVRPLRVDLPLVR